MKLMCVALIAMLACTAFGEEDEQRSSWSWKGEITAATDTKPVYSKLTDSQQYINDQSSNNDTESKVDEVIQTILENGRQGRNLDGYDEVYADPTIQEALQAGDDAQARNLIKDKLCSLGLMQCDGEYAEGKRPYYSPDDLIYAQPIAIKAVGRPIPSVPYRKGPPTHGAYGPPRPMPVPHHPNNQGPPRKVGYGPPSGSGSFDGPPSKPYFSRPPGPGPVYLSKPPGPVYNKYELGSPSGPNFGSPSGPSFESSGPPFQSKPPGFNGASESGYKFEQHQHSHGSQFIDGPPQQKPTLVVAKGPEPVQQHVHHHYHHGEDNEKKTVIVNNPVPVPISSGNSLVNSEFSSSSFQGLSGSSGSNGFTPVSQGFNYEQNKGINSGLGAVNGLTGSGVYGAGGVKPVFESNLGGGLGNTGPASFGQQSNSIYGQSVSGVFNPNTNSFHSSNPDFYKKELNLNGPRPNGLNTFAQSSGLSQYSNQNQLSGQNQFSGQNQLSSGQNQYSGQNQLSSGQNQYSGQNQLSGQNQYSGQNSGQNQYTSQFNTGESYQAFESGRQDNFDCVCVSYDQCPSQDVIGRKDDLILPLDPRNLKTDIEAIGEEAVITDSHGNMTVVRVTKEASEKNENKSEVKEVEVKKDDTKEIKKISKRDVSEKKSDDDKANIEPVGVFFFKYVLVVLIMLLTWFK